MTKVCTGLEVWMDSIAIIYPPPPNSGGYAVLNDIHFMSLFHLKIVTNEGLYRI